MAGKNQGQGQVVSGDLQTSVKGQKRKFRYKQQTQPMIVGQKRQTHYSHKLIVPYR